ncbi:MAG: hypothetical protein WDA60_09350 [Acidimicrobiia bacterium]
MARDGNRPSDDPAAPEPKRPRVDVSPALHEAGNEVKDLGYEGIPDDGPVVHPEAAGDVLEDPLDFVNVQLPSD